MKTRRQTIRPTETKDLGNGLILLRFEDAAQPVFLEKKGKPYILYGKDNDYPNYLLYLYNNSAKHNAIINGKVDYVVGKGVAYDSARATSDQEVRAAAFIREANTYGESLQDVLAKCELDAEIFNGYYLQVVWDKVGEGISSIVHLDYTTVRSNADNTEFYVSDEWVKYNPDGSYKPNNNPNYEIFSAFDAEKKTGTQILYVKKYHPGMDVYTLPSYRGSLTWIEVDVEIGNYHLNNVKGGFFANKIINFNNGIPSQEGQQSIEKQVKEKFTGVRGQKFMIAFNADQNKAATITDLNVSESDKLFDQLNKTTQQEIFTGHRITSPMLFGIRVEGQLGGRSEMRDAYEVFQNTYINGQQQWHERVFNMLASHKGVSVPLVIQRTEPVAFEFSESTQAQNMTQAEIRERMGLAPIKKDRSDKATEIINAINSLSPLVANKVLENLDGDELRALIGLGPKPAAATPQPPDPAQQQFSAEEDERDVAVFSEYGSERKGYIILQSKKVLFADAEQERLHFVIEQENITRIQESILDLLEKDPLSTQQIIADSLGIDVEIVHNSIKDLAAKGLLKVTEKTVRGDKVVERKPVRDARRILRDREPPTRAIQIMYSYEGPEDSRNRPFCAKMMKLNRLYSRSEIEQISQRLGYSVWTRRGGWYTVPGTNIHRPYCRHSWVSNVVVKER